MNSVVRVALVAASLSLSGAASPLSSTARSVLPAEVQQIISVDYRALNDSPSGLALKDKVLPAPLKQFEEALRSAGISPEKDMEQLVFTSFRFKEGLRFIGIAQGQFSLQQLRARLRKRKVRGERYRNLIIYPMASGMSMALLDPTTMVFGERSIVQHAIDTRDGEAKSLNSNSAVTDLMSAVEGEGVWSVLDQQGTGTMLKSALGTASELADYEMVKNRIKGARYTVKFTKGVDFDLSVITSDSITAATLSSVLQAGMMYKKATASDVEKLALENVSVKAQSNSLNMEFKTDDNKFQALLNSDLFAAVSK